MVGLELAIQQSEAACLQPRHEVCEGDLGSIAHPRDHRFAEKGAAQREAVQAADKTVSLPTFDRMGEAPAVKLDEDALDRAVDPSVGPVARGFGAELHNPLEFLIDRDFEAVSQDGFPERSREMEFAERKHAAQLRLDPIDAGGQPVIGHRENPHRISAEDEIGVQL
jgi:hypothetical protein